MRHRKRGRRLGRSSSHRRAMLRNLASSLFLTERDAELDPNPPKVRGRVITTLHKAKEVRPLVEKCITIARKSLPYQQQAEEYETSAEKGTDAWRQWRNGPNWRKWCDARAPVVAARRRALQLLGDKQAVRVLFEEVAPRFADRDGGYTRVLRLATPRLGDAGTRAILEFVGQHDRIAAVSERPAFDDVLDEDDLQDDGEIRDDDHDVVADEENAQGDEQADAPDSPVQQTETAEAEAGSDDGEREQRS
jgi:large subunit ribosomal protein L17